MKKITETLIQKDNPEYEEIGSYIHSKESVVGIDARHTHIVIIKKLIELEERLEKMTRAQKKKPLKKKKAKKK